MADNQGQESNRADQPDRTAALAAELNALRTALYGLIEAFVWLALAAPLGGLLLKVHLPEGFVWPRIFDLSHALLSGGVALVALRLSRRIFQPLFRHSLMHYGIALALAIVCGAGVEVVQRFTHGDPSLKDLARDTVGALAALACVMSIDKTLVWAGAPLAKWSLRLAAAMAIVCVAYPIVRITWQLRERVTSFPRLADFESDADRDFVYPGSGAKLVRIEPPDGFTLAKGFAGQVTFAGGSESPKLEIASVGNWSNSRALSFDVYSEAPAAVRLLVRIDDHRDRRFNMSLIVPPGQSTQRIPVEDVRTGEAGKDLDLARMKAILLFMWEPVETTTLAFDNIHLEN